VKFIKHFMGAQTTKVWERLGYTDRQEDGGWRGERACTCPSVSESTHLRQATSVFVVFNSVQRAVPWFRRSVTGLSPRRPGFVHGSVHVRFMLEKVARG
jgi:hypothetical protein